MSGVRLEARVHIVTTRDRRSAQNVIKCCQRAGLHVVDLVLAPLAAAEAVLSAEEKELGVAVVDIGAGTTGLLVFTDGAREAHRRCCRSAATTSPATSPPACARRSAKPSCSSGATAAALAGAVPPTRWSRCRPSAGARRASCRAASWRRSSSRAWRRSSRSSQRQLIRCGLDTALASGVVLTGGSALMEGVVAARRARLPAAGARRHAARLRGHRRDAGGARVRRRGRSDALRRAPARPICRAWSTTRTYSVACAGVWSAG